MNKENLEKPIIITGLSGAGISTVLKAMEDFRFEVFDNFPIELIPNLLKGSEEKDRVAFAVDTRTRGFSPESVTEVVKETGARLVFITCDESILQRRFAETRRRHPLAHDGAVLTGIKSERELMAPLKQSANIVIDSSDASIHDLRHTLEAHFAIQPEENLTTSLMSFGFKSGIPRDADIVMDVRFLKNPHWDKALKPKTGLDAEVGAYIREDAAFEPFLDNFKTLIEPLLPRYANEGKSYFTIAVGCTGGKHRSVYTVEVLKIWLESKGLHPYIDHRDLPKI